MAKNEILSEIKKAEENAKKMIDDRSLRGGFHD
jgi:vacuolar-type H+-ATPase subunit H